MESTAWESQDSFNAYANVCRVLGNKVLAALRDVHDVPEDWTRVKRGRDLFVKGWGPFDVRAAFEACRHEGLPSAARLRAVGYALKGFSPPSSSDEVLLGILADTDSPLAQHVWCFKEFWDEHVTFLGRVQRHSRNMTEEQRAAEARRDPRQVLQEIQEKLPADPFHWLRHVPDFRSGRGVLEVLKTPRRVLEIGLALNMCCAFGKEPARYVDCIRNMEIALVALLLDGKPKALGELHLPMRVDAGDWDQLAHEADGMREMNDCRACVPSWGQRKERGNRSLRLKFRQMFDEAGPQLQKHLLHTWAVVTLQPEQPRLAALTLGQAVAVGIGSALSENTTARRLDMSGGSVGDEGVHALAKALLRNSTLTALVLAHNDLGDQAAKALAGVMAANHGLLELSLAHNKVTPAGALWLAQRLRLNTSLRLLDLRGNGLPLWVGELDQRILVRDLEGGGCC